MVLVLLYCSVPPPKLMVPKVPRAPDEPKLRMPALMFVAPVKSLAPLSVVVPLPDWVSVPAPLITPDSVCAALVLSTNEAALLMLPA